MTMRVIIFLTGVVEALRQVWRRIIGKEAAHSRAGLRMRGLRGGLTGVAGVCGESAARSFHISRVPFENHWIAPHAGPPPSIMARIPSWKVRPLFNARWIWPCSIRIDAP